MVGKSEKIWDLIICGGGPSGLTAGMYAGRNNMDVLVIDHGPMGGALHITDRIANYLGFPDGISGFELASIFEKHMRIYIPEDNIIAEHIEELTIDKDDDSIKIVRTESDTYRGHCVIIGTGSTPKPIPLQGSERWLGRGLSYCAICDGAFYNNKPVAVVGGGNAAVEEAMFLTRFATQVTIIHRRNELRATPIVQEEAFANPKMKFQWDSIVVGIHGESFINKVEVENVKNGQRSLIDANGLFVYIGSYPNTEYVKIEGLKKDEFGYLYTDENMCVGYPGVYATGDVRAFPLRQISISSGNGAVAALMAERYLVELKHEKRYRGSCPCSQP